MTEHPLPDGQPQERASGEASSLVRAREEIARLTQERDEARIALADAAHEINVAGPVAHRIRVLKSEFEAQLAALRGELDGVREAIYRMSHDAGIRFVPLGLDTTIGRVQRLIDGMVSAEAERDALKAEVESLKAKLAASEGEGR